MAIKDSAGRRLFNLSNILFLCLLTMATLYPMLFVVFASFSNPARFVAFRGVLLHPLGFYTQAYRFVFRNPMFLTGYANTLTVVAAGVCLNLFMTSLGAYFLSRKQVMFKAPIMFLITFTMFFGGGLIPFYLTVRDLKLDNTLLALFVPFAINTFNMIILRTAFMSVPDSLEESARIDGASHYVILFKIIAPVSLPTMAVMVLYYGVGHWNAWFWAFVFLRERTLYPLQLVLREILIQNTMTDMTSSVDTGDAFLVGEIIKYATIVVATAPILALYPFLQKYFVKGIMIGALKG